LSSNYFAAKHFLEREVLPAIDRDLKILEDSTNDQPDMEDKDAIFTWIQRYRRVRLALHSLLPSSKEKKTPIGNNPYFLMAK
jgi:hypothetical protein